MTEGRVLIYSYTGVFRYHTLAAEAPNRLNLDPVTASVTPPNSMLLKNKGTEVSRILY